MTANPLITALIVAAGSSQRFDHAVAKPWVAVNGKSLLAHTIEAFLSLPAISKIMVVIRPQDKELFLAQKFPSPVSFCFGGASRQESVALGLSALAELKPDYVLIHDAARANVASQDIQNLIGQLLARKDCGISLGKKITDSLHKTGMGAKVETSIDRDNLWAAETPQAFPFAAILTAHRQFAGQSVTDDIQLAKRAGVNCEMLQSSGDNFKITFPADLARLEAMKSQMVTRIGHGYDVHALENGSGIILGGIKIIHDKSLVGHSDADVVLHALTDALLGTCGAGDIGLHFPPSDPKWKGAASDQFVREALRLVHEKQGRVINVDCTLIAEEPKISPYRAMMQKNIAQLLGIAEDCVNIKATTSEKMGFVGRGEGIAAHVIASVSYRIPS